jgi:hypothetical protein
MRKSEGQEQRGPNHRGRSVRRGNRARRGFRDPSGVDRERGRGGPVLVSVRARRQRAHHIRELRPRPRFAHRTRRHGDPHRPGPRTTPVWPGKAVAEAGRGDFGNGCPRADEPAKATAPISPGPAVPAATNCPPVGSVDAERNTRIPRFSAAVAAHGTAPEAHTVTGGARRASTGAEAAEWRRARSGPGGAVPGWDASGPQRGPECGDHLEGVGATKARGGGATAGAPRR